MYTEEEAKTKWCPHAVASHTDPRAGFHNDGRPIQFPCIASACMAWRWTIAPAYIGPERTMSHEAYGYCGLAGKPE